ncbi:MAG: maleylpyruvate isomerase family mycothiol-dependent enzyme [Acidimicrobiales bacterium]
MPERPGPDDVTATVDALASCLGSADPSDRAWDSPAGSLDWSCRHTLGHVAECLTWYAANLARRSTASAEVGWIPIDDVSSLVDALQSGGALLAVAVAQAGPTDRGWHSSGIPDRSGFAAMGCDEVLVHGYDIATGLGVAYDPPTDVCRSVLERLFPWTPTESDPWATLLWANGRVPLGDRPPDPQWWWHSSPLADWDGRIRRRA